MKKSLLFLFASLLSGTSVTQAASDVHAEVLKATPMVISNPNRADVQTMSFMTTNDRFVKSPVGLQSRADETNVIVRVSNSDGFSLTFVLAVYQQNGKRKLAGSEDVQADGSIALSVPAGTADFMLMLNADDDSSVCFLSKANAAVSMEGTELTFDVSEATKVVEVTPRTPDGTVISLPEDWDDTNGNCEMEEIINMISYKDTGLAFYAPISFPIKLFTKVQSNFTDDTFSLTQLIFTATKISGGCYAIVPIDFTKTEAGPDTQNWQVSKNTFNTTPFGINYDKMMEEMGATEDDTYTMHFYNVFSDNEWFAGVGNGTTRRSDSGLICTWEPKDYNGQFAYMPSPVGDCFGGYDSAIVGMPLQRTSDGLRPVGRNFAFDRNLAFPATETSLNPANQLFTMDCNNLELGNCAPALITLPTSNARFEYSFTGLHGEEFSIDSWNIYDNVDPEAVDRFGGQTSTVKVYNDGNLICDNRGDFGPWSMDWGNENGKYKAEIETRNVIVDGIGGYSKGVMEYDGAQGAAPTLTALQVRNTSSGEVTNKFTDPSEAEINLYAARLESKYNPQTYNSYCEIHDVSSVKAYYAPGHLDDFTELPLTGDLSKFFDPGYGYFFSGKLDGVNRTSTNGWYKLRIRVECADGAYQEQEIYPAFYISSMTGIGNVLESGTDRFVTVNGRDIIAPASAEVYSVTGMRVGSRSLSPGVYVIRDGGKTTKVVIR